MKTSALPTGTALITGASSGIGAEFARQLARRGQRLVLVARRAERLEALARELKQVHGVTIECLSADLAETSGQELVAQRLQGTPPVEWLINNAGFGSGGLYHETKAPKQMAMIEVHVKATARLIRAVLPAMVQRRQGVIINVASIAAFAMVPTSAMYSSTKLWMVGFTKALAAELEGTGVHIQALCPGFTHTEFHDTEEYRHFNRQVVPSFCWMTAAEVVRQSLHAVERGSGVFIPGWFNRLMVLGMKMPGVQSLGKWYARRRWHGSPSSP
ncbi:SDR family oxidoreductase [Fontisphaera persica]|uniref:SDR family NAD(P)-dependent oxidoreductase n=1 Tax=Fontisphaera persica TaxID=2974023 RepID=UPI0024BF8043|nr:SDR family oxidoreductase [Fontisphaera persica]WCJ60377.1 SDR family oxidoreductase [Fontisphaera persica]